MGEDNIFANGYTIYFDGQPLGVVNGLTFVEEPKDTYFNINNMNKTITAKFKVSNALKDILYPNWRVKYMKALRKAYKKKKSKKH